MCGRHKVTPNAFKVYIFISSCIPWESNPWFWYCQWSICCLRQEWAWLSFKVIHNNLFVYVSLRGVTIWNKWYSIRRQMFTNKSHEFTSTYALFALKSLTWIFMRMDWIKTLNWHFAKTRPLRYCCYDRLTISLSRHMCSHSVKNTSRSKMETDNVPIDKTEQVTCGMKQSQLEIVVVIFFFINSNNKLPFCGSSMCRDRTL